MGEKILLGSSRSDRDLEKQRKKDKEDRLGKWHMLYEGEFGERELVGYLKFVRTPTGHLDYVIKKKLTKEEEKDLCKEMEAHHGFRDPKWR